MVGTPTRTFTWTVPADADGMTSIPVPFDQRALFGKAQPPVVVTLAGHSYRSTITTIGGSPWVPLRRSHRAAAGIAAGEVVDVTLTLDTAPRTVDPPADLRDALAAAGLAAAWDQLSYTHQREHAEAIASAKQPETRARRLAAAVVMVAAKAAKS